jgi:putative salt-induced outer membrane protein
MKRAFVALLCLVPILVTAQEPAPPPEPWTGRVGAGLAITSGNTDTKNFNAAADVKYDPGTRWIFKSDLLWLRGETDGETQVDRLTASAREEYSLSDRSFVFGEVGYLRDPFKEIESLIAPVVGGGYRILKAPDRNLTVDAAAGMQFEDNGVLGSRSDFAIKAGEDFDWALSPTSKFTQKLTGLWKAEDFGDALYHFDAGLVTTVMTSVELKLGYAYDHKTRPPVGIEEGDSSLIATVLYKF